MGSFLVLWGTAVVVFRVRFARFARKVEEESLGEFGRRTGAHFTPPVMAFIGCVFIGAGALVLISLAAGSPVFTV